MAKKSTAELDLTDLELIEKDKAGARARSKHIARKGLPKLASNATLSQRKQEAARYRACIGLMWSREQILAETGWSLQQFLAIERYVRDEDRQLADEVDPRITFSNYKLMQYQAARELEDLAEVFRHSRQFSALVTAIKARSDILDRVIKTGQDLGIVKRAAREVNVNAKIDFRSMNVSELKVHLSNEIKEVNDLFVEEPKIFGPATVVLDNILNNKREVIETNSEPVRKARVKRLLVKKPNKE
jgi:hypothetical protein